MRAMRLPRFTDASLYWICIVVLVAALVDLTWLHRVEPVDLMLGDELMRLRAPSIKADSPSYRAGWCPHRLDRFMTNPFRSRSLSNRRCAPALAGGASRNPVPSVAVALVTQ